MRELLYPLWASTRLLFASRPAATKGRSRPRSLGGLAKIPSNLQVKTDSSALLVRSSSKRRGTVGHTDLMTLQVGYEMTGLGVLGEHRWDSSASAGFTYSSLC